MMTKEENAQAIYLQFDFSNKNNHPIVFSNPETIITTHHIEEVEQCLLQIEQAVTDGKYAAGFLSYEATYALKNLKHKQTQFTFPLVWFGIFTEPEPIAKVAHQSYSISNWQMVESESEYEVAFNSIKNKIQQH